MNRTYVDQASYDGAAPPDDIYDTKYSAYLDEVEFHEEIILDDVEDSVQAFMAYLAHNDEMGEDIYAALRAIVEDALVEIAWDYKKTTHFATILKDAVTWRAKQRSAHILKDK